MQVPADQVHAHINEVGRKIDAHVGVADALQALEVALVIRTLKQGDQPLLMLLSQPGQLGRILQKLGGVGDGQEQTVEVRDDGLDMGFHHRQQAF